MGRSYRSNSIVKDNNPKGGFNSCDIRHYFISLQLSGDTSHGARHTVAFAANPPRLRITAIFCTGGKENAFRGRNASRQYTKTSLWPF